MWPSSRLFYIHFIFLKKQNLVLAVEAVESGHADTMATILLEIRLLFPVTVMAKWVNFFFKKSAIYRRKTIIIINAKIQWIFFKRFQGKCLSIKCERKNFKQKLDFSFWFVCNLIQTFVIFFTFRALKMGLVVLIANYFNGVGAQTDMGNVRLRSSDRSHK